MGPRHGAESDDGDSRTLPERVLRGLRSPFPAVRAWACGKAGGGGIRVQPAVLLTLLDDSSPEVLMAAAKAAGLLGVAPAVPRLIELLDARDPDLSLQAAWALESIGRAASGAAAPAAPKPIEEERGRREGTEFRKTGERRTEAPKVPRSIAPLPGEPGFLDDGSGFLAEGVGLADLGTPTRVALALGLILAFVGGALTGRVVDEPQGQVLRFDDGRPLAAQVLPTEGLVSSSGEVGGEGAGPEMPVSVSVSVPVPVPVPDRVATDQAPAGDDVGRRHAVWLSTAQRYLASGRLREAMAVADRVLDEDPESADARQFKRLAAETYGVLE